MLSNGQFVESISSLCTDLNGSVGFLFHLWFTDTLSTCCYILLSSLFKREQLVSNSNQSSANITQLDQQYLTAKEQQV